MSAASQPAEPRPTHQEQAVRDAADILVDELGIGRSLRWLQQRYCDEQDMRALVALGYLRRKYVGGRLR